VHHRLRQVGKAVGKNSDLKPASAVSSLIRERQIYLAIFGPILFSDILVVPYALGQHVTFAAGEGPRLDALTDPSALRNSDAILMPSPSTRTNTSMSLANASGY
jgi:hypothetical protein